MQLPTLSIAFAAALTALAPGSAHAVADPATEIARLRAEGPAALDALLAEYDRASVVERGALGRRIDAVAAQRYATVSRLYWYTELDRAREAARRLHRPILALRMLGDLRDDLSCANSRLFRATLYANAEVSAFLRANFVLYWSSERPVPTVTIDFGDGRTLVRTATGNSAHYVLDEQGHVLDVLPGLYAPVVFTRELTTSLALAKRVRGMSDRARISAVAAHHNRAVQSSFALWQTVAGTGYIPQSRFLVTPVNVVGAAAQAQATTVSKAVMEVPDLRTIGAIRPGEVPDDAAAWAAIGLKVWNIAVGAHPGAFTAEMADPRGPPPAPTVLDARSRALVGWLHNAGAVRRATPDELAAVIGRLEQHIVADTALNQFMLRERIRGRLISHGEADFTALNAWIYDRVFATPQSDPWLGLLPRGDFTGLPGDGVVAR